ncbi:MAG: hypothetical protein Q4D42_12355 [Eubacteriales bacterium]|nr:hypothetical protein [Eubacteriales bacterium]
MLCLLTQSVPEIDLTWTITAIIAACALISPVLTAIINNWHHMRVRKFELKHDATVKQFDIYYADKQKAFDDFAKAAGMYAMDHFDEQSYGKLHSAISASMLVCSPQNKEMLCEFGHYANHFFNNSLAVEERKEYLEKLFSVCDALNKDLSETHIIE